MGTQEQAIEFFGQFGPADIRHVSDPKKQLYKAFGIRRAKALQVLGPRVISAGYKAYSEGFRQGATVGDPMQLSGAFLVHQGQVRAAHIAEFAGDEPDFSEIAAGAADVCEIELD